MNKKQKNAERKKAVHQNIKRRAMIKIDPAENLDLRDKDSYRFNSNIKVPEKFIVFADKKIMPELAISGYKTDEKKNTIIKQAYSLITAGLVDYTIADYRSRNKTRKSVIDCWDMLVSAKLARKCPGSEQSGKVTRYYASDKLLSFYDDWPMKLLFCKDEKEELESLVRIKSNKDVDFKTYLEKIYGTDPKQHPSGLSIENGCDFISRIENLIIKINEVNANHTFKAYKKIKSATGKIKYTAFPIQVNYRQIHSQEAFRAVRLYTVGFLNGQGISKEQRKTITIDSETATELDFKGHQLRILYNLKRLDCPYDPYQPAKICPVAFSSANLSNTDKKEIRSLIKVITIATLHCRSKNEAIGVVKSEIEKRTEQIKNIIYKTELSGAKDLLNRIEKVHPEKVRNEFYTGIGVSLMTADGYIAKRILINFTEAEKPCLSIHDSIVIKKSDTDFGKQQMKNAYFNIIGFGNPIIKTEF